MLRDVRVTVSPTQEGWRADKALPALCLSTNRRAVARAFAEREVSLLRAGAAVAEPLAKGDRVHAGDALLVARLYETDDLRVIPEPDAPLEVVCEDADLLGLDKPAGIACHPLDFGETGTLANALVARYPETAGLGDDPLMPGLLHRIDGGTSGLVLAARNARAYAAVRAQFEAQTVVKEYRALVEGAVERPGAVSGLLAHSYKGGEMRMVAAAPGHHGARALKAETFYRPLRRLPGGATLLAVTIRTGVTHQIRCQLASIGHPVVGDVLYGARPSPDWRPGTHALQSFSIECRHPSTGEKTRICLLHGLEPLSQ